MWWLFLVLGRGVAVRDDETVFFVIHLPSQVSYDRSFFSVGWTGLDWNKMKKLKLHQADSTAISWIIIQWEESFDVGQYNVLLVSSISLKIVCRENGRYFFGGLSPFFEITFT